MALLSDYIIEQTELDWSSILETWQWLLPNDFNLWIINKFGDLIIEYNDGTINYLSTDDGTLTRIAKDKNDFIKKADDLEFFKNYFYTPIVDELTQNGIILGESQCYGFRISPILGGSYGLENITLKDISEYINYLGHHYEQLSKLEDGTKVKLVIRNTDI